MDKIHPFGKHCFKPPAIYFNKAKPNRYTEHTWSVCARTHKSKSLFMFLWWATACTTSFLHWNKCLQKRYELKVTFGVMHLSSPWCCHCCSYLTQYFCIIVSMSGNHWIKLCLQVHSVYRSLTDKKKKKKQGNPSQNNVSLGRIIILCFK